MSREAVLFANEAFYRAFADRDYAAMDALWLRDGSVACIHPGWPALHEREQIMQTWEQIFENRDNEPPREVRGVRCILMDNTAMVIGYEIFADGALIATNVFRRNGAVWAIVHHQASPTDSVPARREEQEEPEPLLN